MTEKGFLITPSLYSAWQYWMNSGKDKTEILKTLNKAEFEKTGAMLEGIAFEDEIRKVCEGGISYDPCVLEIAGIVKGGLWQQRVSCELGGDMVYGVADVIKRNTIYDIKFTGSYETGKYESSIQHLVYMYSTGIPNFEYLISDGGSVYSESYHWGPGSLDILRERIAGMKGSILADAEMAAAFIKNWKYGKEK